MKLKLTRTQTNQIRRLLKHGVPVARIARQLNISYWTVWQVYTPTRRLNEKLSD